MLAVLALFNAALRANSKASLSRFLGIADALAAHDDAARREVRAGKNLHQIVYRAIRIVDHHASCVDCLAEVMRGDVCCHANGNTRRAVYQQVREA